MSQMRHLRQHDRLLVESERLRTATANMRAPLSEDVVSREATRPRAFAGMSLQESFRITEFVERVLPRWLREQGKGDLRIAFFDAEDGADYAYVTFHPITLHVDRQLWKEADLGEPSARYVLAHEIGHIVLHNHLSYAFSPPTTKTGSWGINGLSVEHEANRFAHHLLVPNEVALQVADIRAIARRCSVTMDVANDRYQAVSRLVCAVQQGAPCPECGNFTLVRNGTCLKCDTCGSTTGCS
jgi:hypothetical protein